jgi:hypothetical protein
MDWNSITTFDKQINIITLWLNKMMASKQVRNCGTAFPQLLIQKLVTQMQPFTQNSNKIYVADAFEKYQEILILHN